MPTATEALRAEWGISDRKAIEHLERRGFVLTAKWQWMKPPQLKHITKKDLRAIDFLAQEWDFGGLHEEEHP